MLATEFTDTPCKARGSSSLTPSRKTATGGALGPLVDNQSGLRRRIALYTSRFRWAAISAREICAGPKELPLLRIPRPVGATSCSAEAW
jgi:hypothetical protein